jgi:hypothetical protein
MSDDWVEAKACSWIHEALFFRSVLEAAGIESMIPNEHTISMQPLYANLLGGVRVLVRAADLDRAKELLDSAAAPPDPDTSGEE